MDSRKLSKSATRRRDSEVLPAPAGLDINSRRPRRTVSHGFAWSSWPASLHILHLLAELFDRGFEVQAHCGQGGKRGLGAEGVGFAHELLGQEVQPPADRRVGGEQLS